MAVALAVIRVLRYLLFGSCASAFLALVLIQLSVVPGFGVTWTTHDTSDEDPIPAYSIKELSLTVLRSHIQLERYCGPEVKLTSAQAKEYMRQDFPVGLRWHWIDEFELGLRILAAEPADPPLPDVFPGNSGLVIPIWAATMLCMVYPAMTLARWRHHANHCKACGYNLTGNVTGICSECGARV